MIEVKLNNSNENPFYGLKNCLTLFQNVNNEYLISNALLDACYDEVKDDKQKREMFFSLLFSIGDITARQHNIFKGVKKDNGGNANREGFYKAFVWLFEKHYDQFAKFLNAGLFNEYTCFELLFRSRVKTKNNRIIGTYDLFSNDVYRKLLLEYVYAIINGNNAFNKLLVAKFLTLPRLSKRKGHAKMLPQTREIMLNKVKFLSELSDLMKWEYYVNDSIANFKGYREWRKEYNGDLESKVFSTGMINTFTEDQFIQWIDKMPAQARFRVKNRVLYGKDANDNFKWGKFGEWYKKWEAYKEEKQSEQRVLEEKVRQGQATNEDVEKLAKVKKEAKVNVGATNFDELYKDICKGTVDALKLEAFMNKVNLPYNSLVIIDDSGSMSGAPFNFATFIAAVCLCKNPDDDGRNLLGFFDNYTHWHSYIDSTTTETANSIMRRHNTVKIAPKPFVDPKKSFLENYQEIDKFCRSVFQSGCTNISSIPEGLNDACKRHPEIKDALKAYPVWTIITDGEWNNLWSPEASMNDFFRKCKNYFGFKPYIVAMDITSYGVVNVNRFSGIDNMMYIPANPAQIEQFLTNFKDMDVYDVFTPLQSMYRSNRYEAVRQNVI